MKKVSSANLFPNMDMFPNNYLTGMVYNFIAKNWGLN